MDRRVLLLLISGGVIAGLCAFKATRHFAPQTGISSRPIVEPAPEFELYDQSSPSRIVRLEGYLGRERVIVVFFDGHLGAHASTVLDYLRENWTRLRKAEIAVMAVSAALPQENRKEIRRFAEYPFPLLSDPDFRVHRAWGRWDPATGKPLSGVFCIDRKGWVNWSRETNHPQPADDWRTTVEKMIASS
jgi:peroxiredoxin